MSLLAKYRLGVMRMRLDEMIEDATTSGMPKTAKALHEAQETLLRERDEHARAARGSFQGGAERVTATASFTRNPEKIPG